MIACTQCGHRNQEGTEFCRNPGCGTFLEWTGERVDTATIPVADVIAADRTGVVALLAHSRLNVEAGSEVSTEVRVRNTGRLVDQVSLELLGDPSAWSSVDPPSLNLLPQAEEVARLAFRPPRSPRVPAGSAPFRLRAVSKEDPRTADVVDGNVEVGPFWELTGELVPQRSSGRKLGIHELTLKNQGNCPVTARLEACDPDRALAFTVTPSTVTVPAGDQARARVEVRPRDSRLYGSSETYAFQITAETDVVDPLSYHATMLHEALLPEVTRGRLWLLRIFFTLLGASLLIGGASLTWAGGVAGVDLRYDRYVEAVFDVDVRPPPDGVPSTLTAVGLAAQVLGAVAGLGLISRSGRLTRLAGGFGLLLFGAFIVSIDLADLSLGLGAIAVAAGAVVALLGGLVAMFMAK